MEKMLGEKLVKFLLGIREKEKRKSLKRKSL